MSSKYRIAVTVNGTAHDALVEPRQSLADFLRMELRLTGTHVGCEHGVCGACTVLLSGVSVRACLCLAVQTDGEQVETVESPTLAAELKVISAAFREHHALQCGFCTPGMLLTCVDLLRHHALANETQIRAGLAGNLCRCTGYEHIVQAVAALAKSRSDYTPTTDCVSDADA